MEGVVGRWQCKITFDNLKGNMATPEPCGLKTGQPEHLIPEEERKQKKMTLNINL